jgi:hypothetical protein
MKNRLQSPLPTPTVQDVLCPPRLPASTTAGDTQPRVGTPLNPRCLVRPPSPFCEIFLGPSCSVSRPTKSQTFSGMIPTSLAPDTNLRDFFQPHPIQV